MLYPRVEWIAFRSRVLGRSKRFAVVRPTERSAAEREWPVVFLLHGKGRHERSLVDDSRTRAVLLGAGFVTVLPDGDTGWWIDSPVDRESRYERYLNEVIRVAESIYGLSRDRTKRGLAGWSMGGYGAVRYAARHPDAFGAVASVIGVLDYPGRRPGRDLFVVGEETVFGTDPEVWDAYNPINLVEKLRRTSVLLITGKTAFDRKMNERFRQRMIATGNEPRWLVLEGGHTFALVAEALPKMVAHLEESLGLPRVQHVGGP